MRGFPSGLDSKKKKKKKNLSPMPETWGSLPRSGRFPGEENGYPL